MSKLIEAYRKALQSVNYFENDAHELEYRFTDGDGKVVAVAATVESMPLLMPVSEVRTGNQLAERVLFHPLSEDVMNGESEVLQFLRRAMVVRFNATLCSMLIWMVETAINPKEAKRFGPKQKEFFNILADASDKTLTTLGKLVTVWLKRDTPYTLSKIYLRRTGATYMGKKMTRVAVVTFPFMEEEHISTKDKKTYWCGVEISKKDLNMLRNLVEYVIPHAGEVSETYNAGSSDPHAPYFDCLIHSFAKLMEPLNHLIKLFGDKYDGKENGYCDVTWVEDFEPINQHRGQIPPAKYNMGVTLNSRPQPTVKPNPSAAAHEGMQPRPASTGSVIDNLLGKTAPVQPNQWESGGNQPAGNSTFDALMNRVAERNGTMFNNAAWPGMGVQPAGWGMPPAPQSPNGLRRRAEMERNNILSAWTGRTVNRF